MFGRQILHLYLKPLMTLWIKSVFSLSFFIRSSSSIVSWKSFEEKNITNQLGKSRVMLKPSTKDRIFRPMVENNPNKIQKGSTFRNIFVLPVFQSPSLVSTDLQMLSQHFTLLCCWLERRRKKTIIRQTQIRPKKAWSEIIFQSKPRTYSFRVTLWAVQ